MCQDLGLNSRNVLDNEATDWRCKKSADSGGRQTWAQIWNGHLGHLTSEPSVPPPKRQCHGPQGSAYLSSFISLPLQALATLAFFQVLDCVSSVCCIHGVLAHSIPTPFPLSITLHCRHWLSKSTLSKYLCC